MNSRAYRKSACGIDLALDLTSGFASVLNIYPIIPCIGACYSNRLYIYPNKSSLSSALLVSSGENLLHNKWMTKPSKMFCIVHPGSTIDSSNPFRYYVGGILVHLHTASIDLLSTGSCAYMSYNFEFLKFV